MHHYYLWTPDSGRATLFTTTTAYSAPYDPPKPRVKPITVDPPKAEGSLWTLSQKHDSPGKPELCLPASATLKVLWTENREISVPGLWTRATAKRTTTLKPQRGVSVPHKSSTLDLPKAVGFLWTGNAESVLKEEMAVKVPFAGKLWTAPPLKEVLPAVDIRKTPLWSKATASRTTDTKPERGISAVRNEGIDLPKATGSLWSKPLVIIKKPVVASSTGLWRKPVFDEVEVKGLEVEAKVGGSLWIAMPSPVSMVAASPKTLLWSKETAARTTTALPERGIKAVREASTSLPKATGSLWNVRDIAISKIVPLRIQTVEASLWSHSAATSPTASLWDLPALSRTSSTASIVSNTTSDTPDSEDDEPMVVVQSAATPAAVVDGAVISLVEEKMKEWQKAVAVRQQERDRYCFVEDMGRNELVLQAFLERIRMRIGTAC